MKFPFGEQPERPGYDRMAPGTYITLFSRNDEHGLIRLQIRPNRRQAEPVVMKTSFKQAPAMDAYKGPLHEVQLDINDADPALYQSFVETDKIFLSGGLSAVLAAERPFRDVCLLVATNAALADETEGFRDYFEANVRALEQSRLDTPARGV